MQSALDIGRLLNTDVTLATPFPNTTLGNQMRQIAKVINESEGAAGETLFQRWDNAVPRALGVDNDPSKISNLTRQQLNQLGKQWLPKIVGALGAVNGVNVADSQAVRLNHGTFESNLGVGLNLGG